MKKTPNNNKSAHKILYYVIYKKKNMYVRFETIRQNIIDI